MHKIVVLFFLLCYGSLELATCNPLFGESLLGFTDSIGSNRYTFGYKSNDGSSRQEKGELINAGTPEEEYVVRGETSWYSPEGIRFRIGYVADKLGYRPTVMKMESPGVETSRSASGTQQVTGNDMEGKIGSGTAAALIGKK